MRTAVTLGRLHFDDEPRFCLIARLLSLHGRTGIQSVAVLAAGIRVRVRVNGVGVRVNAVEVRVGDRDRGNRTRRH